MYHRPVLRYHTTGEVEVGKVRQTFSTGEFKVGDSHPIYYNACTPGRIALVQHSKNALIATIFLALSGVALVGLAIALL